MGIALIHDAWLVMRWGLYYLYLFWGVSDNPQSRGYILTRQDFVAGDRVMFQRKDQHYYTEGRIMGGEGAHIVETHMFCTVCLKSSCLSDLCFHSWSLDLSQTLIQTIQILKEEKTGPKPMEKRQKPKKTKKTKSCSLQPIISFERGSNCAEHAINFSNMWLYFYIFTKVQYIIHCRKQGCFQDAWFFSQKNNLFKIQAVFSGSAFLKFQLRFHAQSVLFPLQMCYCFSTRQRFKAKYRWCLEKV